MGWAPGARITEADLAGDVKSLRRRLEDRLVLLVKGQGVRGRACSFTLACAPLRFNNGPSRQDWRHGQRHWCSVAHVAWKTR